MEHHHAAERHLYPELLTVFHDIKQQYPDVIIGAVTDGRANSLFVTFTLAPYFDYCMSWEDDQGNRQKFFKELGSVEGNVELKWIYDAALEKYHVLSENLKVMKNKNVVKNDVVVAAGGSDDGSSGGEGATGVTLNNKEDEPIWIYVGDDLAYDDDGDDAE
jgi:hypothetical protein